MFYITDINPFISININNANNNSSQNTNNIEKNYTCKSDNITYSIVTKVYYSLYLKNNNSFFTFFTDIGKKYILNIISVLQCVNIYFSIRCSHIYIIF